MQFVFTDVEFASAYCGGVSDKKPTDGEAKSVRVASNELIIRAGTAESKAVPDLVRRYWYDFAPELMALGWRGTVIKGPDIAVDPASVNGVVTQYPPAR